MALPTHPYVLAFDSNCGPCSRFKSVVELLDIRRRISFVSLESAEGSGLLDSITPCSRYASFHFIRFEPGPRGGTNLWSGAEGVTALLRVLLPWGRVTSRAIEALPAGRASIRFAYSAVSRLHRSCPAVSHGMPRNESLTPAQRPVL